MQLQETFYFWLSFFALIFRWISFFRNFFVPLLALKKFLAHLKHLFPIQNVAIEQSANRVLMLFCLVLDLRKKHGIMVYESVQYKN